jgi:5-(carboxyamino)imidazole ribonucleotide mutase
MAEVAIVMGSKSDWPVLELTMQTLKEFGVKSEVRIMSAHRTPHEAAAFAENAEKNGFKVIIGAAGGAAHLAGVLAGHSILPVIGVPVKGWALDGMDSLLSTVQMPKGVPVATVAIGKAGAINAAILAVQMLSIGNPELKVSVFSITHLTTVMLFVFERPSGQASSPRLRTVAWSAGR